ncbi:DMT family transporter [Acidipropionibacterium virtanenii]|nr:DMT family transporter [Acidipropionibacterium virtanenii]
MALLWGSTLVVMKSAYAHLSPTDLLANRFVVGALALGVLMPRAWRANPRTIARGLSLGMLFGAGQVLQALGLRSTSASVNGFIGGLYVVVTPLLGAMLFGRRVPRQIWTAVALATVGLGSLALNPADLGAGIGIGELLTFAASVCFAGQIVALGRFATASNVASLALYQTIGAALVCMVCAAPGGIRIASSGQEWFAVIYLGVLCGAMIAFLQSWAQARVEATRASVIMCTEPLWGAAFAIWLAGDPVTLQVILGGASILAAMILVVRPPRRRRGTAALRPDRPVRCSRGAHPAGDPALTSGSE